MSKTELRSRITIWIPETKTFVIHEVWIEKLTFDEYNFHVNEFVNLK